MTWEQFRQVFGLKEIDWMQTKITDSTQRLEELLTGLIQEMEECWATQLELESKLEQGLVDQAAALQSQASYLENLDILGQFDCSHLSHGKGD